MPVGLGGQDNGALGSPPEVTQGPEEAHVLLEHHVHFLHGGKRAAREWKRNRRTPTTERRVGGEKRKR